MTHSSETLKERNAALKALYQKWPEIKRYLGTLGCKTADAEDIFQEALLLFTRRLDDPDFELTVAPFHYVKSTCKFLWYNASRKQAKTRAGELHENISEEESNWIFKELKLRQIESAIAKIGKQCQQLLKLFYGGGLSMTAIAQKVGLRNDKVAKAQKYRCINKVKEIIDASEDSKDVSFTSLNA